MRVLHLTRDFPPRINGGLSTAVGEMVRAMAKAVESRVISFDGWRRGAPATALPSTADVFRASGPDAVAPARAWGLAVGADLVHVHDPLLFSLASEIAADRPVVLSLHVLAHHQDRLRGLDRPTRSAEAQMAAIAGATAVIAPSPEVAARLRADVPDAGAIVCAPLFCADTAAARASAVARTDREPTGVVLFCGRFSDMSGVDQLGPIAAALARRAPAAQLVVAGGLPDNPRSDRRWRERLGADLGQRARLTGWLDGRALEAERAAADVFIAPARYATFGMAALEAMLSGLPVVAYRTGGLADLVLDGETGRLVDPGNPGALARAVTDLLEHPDEALALGAAARDRALERFGPDVRIGDVLDLYGHIVDTPTMSR